MLDPALHAPTDRIDAELRLLATEPKPLGRWVAGPPAHRRRRGRRAHRAARPRRSRRAATGFVQLVLDAPVAAAVLDRFILRDVSARRTIGGGRLLDLRAPGPQAPHARAPRPARRRRASPTRRARSPPCSPPRRASSTAPPSPATARLTEAEAAAAFAARGRCGDRRARGRAGAARRAARPTSRRRSPAFHADNPELQGIGRERLRLALGPRLPKEVFLAFLRREAEAGRVVLDGAFVRLPGHEVRLSPADEALWAAIAPGLGGAARFRPPRVRDFAGGARDRRARDAAGAEALRPHRAASTRSPTTTSSCARPPPRWSAIAADVAAEAEGGWFTAAAFRDRMDNGRKVAIQILDFFDRAGVTLRRGDLRRINPHRLDLFAVSALPG